MLTSLGAGAAAAPLGMMEPPPLYLQAPHEHMGTPRRAMNGHAHAHGLSPVHSSGGGSGPRANGGGLAAGDVEMLDFGGFDGHGDAVAGLGQRAASRELDFDLEPLVDDLW
jgi:hypothetical protein